MGAPRVPCGTRGKKSHWGIPGSKDACAYPGLFAACRALPRRSSQAIPQTAWHVGLTECRCLFGVGMGHTIILCMVFIMSVLQGSLHPSPPIVLGGCIYGVCNSCRQNHLNGVLAHINVTPLTNKLNVRILHLSTHLVFKVLGAFSLILT